VCGVEAHGLRFSEVQFTDMEQFTRFKVDEKVPITRFNSPPFPETDANCDEAFSKKSEAFTVAASRTVIVYVLEETEFKLSTILAEQVNLNLFD
jgi:hypothetical protein